MAEGKNVGSERTDTQEPHLNSNFYELSNCATLLTFRYVHRKRQKMRRLRDPNNNRTKENKDIKNYVRHARFNALKSGHDNIPVLHFRLPNRSILMKISIADIERCHLLQRSTQTVNEKPTCSC